MEEEKDNSSHVLPRGADNTQTARELEGEPRRGGLSIFKKTLLMPGTWTTLTLRGRREKLRDVRKKI